MNKILCDAATISIIKQINAKTKNIKQQEEARNYSKHCKRKEILRILLTIIIYIIFMVIPAGIAGSIELGLWGI